MMWGKVKEIFYVSSAQLFKAARDGGEDNLILVKKYLTQNQNNSNALNVTDIDGYTALMIAAEAGNLSIAQVLLGNQHIDSQITSLFEGSSALHLAVKQKNLPMVQALIKRTDVNLRDKMGRTPLFWATQREAWDIFKLLLAEPGIDFNAYDNEDISVLLVAAYRGLPMVETLLALQGIQVNHASRHGITPLMAAAETGNKPIVHALIEHGADASMLDDQNMSAQQKARRQVFIKLAFFLFKVEFLHNIRNGDMSRLNTYFKSYDRFLGEVVDQQGNNALMLAAFHGHKEVVKRLIQSNLTINLSAKNNLLQTAEEIACLQGNVEIVQLLQNATFIAAAAQGNLGYVQNFLEAHLHDFAALHFTIRDKTALVLAAQNGHLAIVQALIDTPKIAESQCIAALNYAVREGHVEVVEYLLKNPALPIDDSMGHNLLTTAVFQNNLPILKLLITDKRIDINSQALSKHTALHHAAHRGQLDAVKVLIAHGADPGLTRYHETADSWARQNNRTEISNYLLKLRFLKIVIDGNKKSVADFFSRYRNKELLHATNEDGDSAIVLAIRHGHLEIIKLLIAQGSVIDTNALIYASLNGYQSVVELLLDVPGIEIDARSPASGNTALICAVQQGHLAVAIKLIEKEADISLMNNSQATAEDIARMNGHLEIAAQLRDKGLIQAVIQGKQAHVHEYYLKQNKEEFAKQISLWNKAYFLALRHDHGEIIQILKDYRDSSLLSAATEGNLTLVRALMNCRAHDLNIIRKAELEAKRQKHEYLGNLLEAMPQIIERRKRLEACTLQKRVEDLKCKADLNEFLGPIHYEVIDDPVIIHRQLYDRRELFGYFESKRNNGELPCPITRQSITREMINDAPTDFEMKEKIIHQVELLEEEYEINQVRDKNKLSTAKDGFLNNQPYPMNSQLNDVNFSLN